VTFRDDRARELLDVPDAPRPDPAAAAPVRFLPEYDNVLLSHDDRTRFVSQGTRAALSAAGGTGSGSVLHDGFLCGVWRLERPSTLVVTHTGLTKRAAASVAAEGRRLLRFLAPQSAERDVRLTEA
jgi:hypothetical protein